MAATLTEGGELAYEPCFFESVYDGFVRTLRVTTEANLQVWTKQV